MLVNYGRETGSLGTRQQPAEAASVNESNLKSWRSCVYFLRDLLAQEEAWVDTGQGAGASVGGLCISSIFV